jgi:hypothetical protein
VIIYGKNPKFKNEKGAIQFEIKISFGFDGGNRLVWCEANASRTMRDEQYKFLSLLGQLPLRLTSEQAAWVLNCQPHDISALVSLRILKPLGNPPANGIKFFATAEILENAKDRSWLGKLSGAITQHWKKKNMHKKNRLQDGGIQLSVETEVMSGF